MNILEWNLLAVKVKMSSMKVFRDLQRTKRFREKEKNKNIPDGCNKQFQDCPEEVNKEDCGTCPFFWKK